MKPLFVLGYYNEQGQFERFVRKGRNGAISGYDNITGARRGLAQSRSGRAEEYKKHYKILEANSLKVVE